MRLLWSQALPALRGLVLARERGWVLAWDEQRGLHLFGRHGDRQALIHTPAAVTAACCADDGSCFAFAAAGAGRVGVLAPDLTPRWEWAAPRPVTALALDPLGQYLAAADRDSQVYLIDHRGRPVWCATAARPLHHLAFVPEKPFLLGASDFGLAACFDGRGQGVWRDGLTSHVGSLAVSGDGGRVVLACYSDGLCCYALDRGTPQRLPLDAPCHLAAVSYSGQLLLTAGPGRVCLRQPDGLLRDQLAISSSAIALALGPGKDLAVVGVAEGKILALENEGNGSPS